MHAMTFKGFDLSGKTALITGSSQGIGLAIAQGLGEAGARVIINGRDKAKLDAARADLAGNGITVSVSAFDVTDETAVNTAIAGIEKDGAIDILFNNAGMQFRTTLEDYPLAKWRELMRVNVESAFIVSKAVAKGMIARKAGKIINISSVQSELGRPTIAPYTATKGAIKMLTKGMCADWAKHNIQINAIGPGYFKTPLNQALVGNPEFSSWLEKRTPAGRWGTTDELIGAAIFLASPASSFVNGHILYVDGGITSVL
jgi:gluconate 5-dehydrogenase